MVDGGLGVNMITKEIALRLGLTLEPTTFNVRMADNTMEIPKGIVKSVEIQVVGMEFPISLVVLTMKTTTERAYQRLSVGKTMA